MKNLKSLNFRNLLYRNPDFLFSGEHFGIVPLEAMYSKTGVVAVNDGGPTETVEDEVTGITVPCN